MKSLKAPTSSNSIRDFLRSDSERDEDLTNIQDFADDNSLFSKVNGTRNSQNALNSDIESISNWA